MRKATEFDDPWLFAWSVRLSDDATEGEQCNRGEDPS